MPSYLLPPFLLHLWESSLMAEKAFLPWLLLKSIISPHGRETSLGHSTATAENVTKITLGFTKRLSRHCAGKYGVKEKQIKLAFHKYSWSRGKTIVILLSGGWGGRIKVHYNLQQLFSVFRQGSSLSPKYLEVTSATHPVSHQGKRLQF